MIPPHFIFHYFNSDLSAIFQFIMTIFCAAEANIMSLLRAIIPNNHLFTIKFVYSIFLAISLTTTTIMADHLKLKCDPHCTVEELDGKYVCATSESDLGKIDVNSTGNAKILPNNIVQFTPNDNMNARFMTLTPCKDKQYFEVIVDNYIPDYMPEDSNRMRMKLVTIITKEGKQREVPSCMQLLQQTTNMSFIGNCEVVNNTKAEPEDIACEYWEDPDYPESDYHLKCSTKFSIACNLPHFVAPIKGKPNYFYFPFNIWVNGEIYANFPCKYKLRSIEGFRLLLNRADPASRQIQTEGLHDCISNEDLFCPFETRTTTSTMPPSNLSTNASVVVIVPTAVTKIPLPFSSCAGTWPFILLFALLAILLLILLVLLILGLLPNKNKENMKGNDDYQADMMRNAEPFMAAKSVALGYGEKTVTGEDRDIAVATVITEYKSSAEGVEVPETLDEADDDQPGDGDYECPGEIGSDVQPMKSDYFSRTRTQN